MLDMFDKLREKPESYRRKVAVAIPTVVVGFMAIVWITTFSVEFPDFANSPQNQAAAIMANPDASNNNGESPFQSLQDGLSNGVNSIKQNFNTLSSSGSATTTDDSADSSNVVILTPDGNSQ